jgi:hypothetical protein
MAADAKTEIREIMGLVPGFSLRSMKNNPSSTLRQVPLTAREVHGGRQRWR